MDQKILSIICCSKIPEPLLRAYNATIETSYKGVVQRFYEKLAEECPQALKFFPGTTEEEIKE